MSLLFHYSPYVHQIFARLLLTSKREFASISSDRKMAGKMKLSKKRKGKTFFFHSGLLHCATDENVINKIYELGICGFCNYV